MLIEKSFAINKNGTIVKIIQIDPNDIYYYLIVNIKEGYLDWVEKDQLRELSPLEQLLYKAEMREYDPEY